MVAYDDEEEFVATLVHPDEYSHQLNAVTGLTSKYISFLKRKFVSRSGSEIIKYPLGDCRAVFYRVDRPLGKILLGGGLLALLGFIGYMLVLYWDSLEPNTRVPVGLLALAGIYGVRWAFDSRRHTLIFVLKDESRLIWKSRSGDFTAKTPSVNKILEFAKSRGLLRDPALNLGAN